MSEARYKIVFNGEVMPEMALDTVKDNLARLFKSDRAKIDNLFSGSAVALKRDLPESEADKYLTALQRAGAKVRKEPDQAASLTLVETDDHRPVESAPPTSTARMECPKCGHEQPQAAECSACGIIIEKYLARQTQLEKTAPTVSPSPYAPPQAQVGEELPEFGELKVFTTNGRIGRLRYLAWSLVMTLAAAGLLGIAAAGFAIADTVGILLMSLVFIGLLVVSVQIGVQRLHDIGWSGWLFLLNLVPIVGSVFPLLMLIIPGTASTNRYGPPQPPNSTAVKVLASLWLALLVLIFIFAIAGGLGMLEAMTGFGSDFDMPSDYSYDPEAADPAAAAPEWDAAEEE